MNSIFRPTAKDHLGPMAARQVVDVGAIEKQHQLIKKP
jgi:hypothetical protein